MKKQAGDGASLCRVTRINPTAMFLLYSHNGTFVCGVLRRMDVFIWHCKLIID